MADTYGTRWHTQYGDAVRVDRAGLTRTASTWQQELNRSGLTAEQVAAGIASLVDTATGEIDGEGWPPTLPEFIGRCRPRGPAAPYHRDFPKALPAPANRETGLAALAGIRSMLRGG